MKPERVELTSARTGRAVRVALQGLPPAANDGLLCSPGWVDLQVNGFGGLDLNAPRVEPEMVGAITRALLLEGVTAWCPTLITAPGEQLERSLRAIARACQSDPLARACVAGIHLEGPYISPVEGTRGAHPQEQIRPPDWDEFCRLQQAAGGRIRIVTLAPEIPGGLDFIRRLAESGVLPAIGHTAASAEVLQLAAAAGARLSTHLGNGLPALLERHANPIWPQLAEDGLWASFIFDGFHLPAAAMRALLRAKGLRRSLLVSDATSLAGMPPGIYATSVGGRVELSAAGRLSLYGTPYLAGSAASLRAGFENALRLAGCSLAEAVRLCAVNPRRLLGLRQNAITLFRQLPGGEISVRAAAIDGKIISMEPSP